MYRVTIGQHSAQDNAHRGRSTTPKYVPPRCAPYWSIGNPANSKSSAIVSMFNFLSIEPSLSSKTKRDGPRPVSTATTTVQGIACRRTAPS